MTTEARKIAASIAKGVELLNRSLGEGWEALIDPKIFRIDSPSFCVLGQLCDRNPLAELPCPENFREATPFERAGAKLGLFELNTQETLTAGSFVQAVTLGFASHGDYDDLQRDWEDYFGWEDATDD